MCLALYVGGCQNVVFIRNVSSSVTSEPSRNYANCTTHQGSEFVFPLTALTTSKMCCVPVHFPVENLSSTETPVVHGAVGCAQKAIVAVTLAPIRVPSQAAF